MRRSITWVVAAMLFSLTAGGCGLSSSGNCPLFCNDKSMIESAKQLDADFVAAFNKGDADATAAYYWNSPDFVLYPPGEMECRGWQQAHDALARVFKNNPSAQLRLIDPQYQVAGKDVIGYGRWSLTPPSGPALQGRYTAIIAKKDSKWVIMLDHPSVPMGEPGK